MEVPLFLWDVPLSTFVLVGSALVEKQRELDHLEAEGGGALAKPCDLADQPRLLGFAPPPGMQRRLRLGFGVQGSGFRVQGPGFRVQGSGFRVQGPGFRVRGSRLQAPDRERVRSCTLHRLHLCMPSGFMAVLQGYLAQNSNPLGPFS